MNLHENAKQTNGFDNNSMNANCPFANISDTYSEFSRHIKHYE